jgi:hypothetical protein
MCCCALCVIVSGPSPTTGVTRRTRAALTVAHPQVPCNRWRARQGDVSAGNCPESAPQRANAHPIVASTTSRSTSRPSYPEHPRRHTRAAWYLADHEARYYAARRPSSPLSSIASAANSPRIHASRHPPSDFEVNRRLHTEFDGSVPTRHQVTPGASKQAYQLPDGKWELGSDF